MKRKIIICAIIISACFNHAKAQTYYAMGPGVNEKVFAITNDASNNIYAGGSFTAAGGSPANYIAKWDGANWSPLVGGANYYVRSLLYYNSTLYVGGGFNQVNGSTIAWGVATWNGSAWSNVGSGIHGDVYALTVYNSQIYAGGFFDTLSGFNPGRGILKWNGSTWVSIDGVLGGGVGGAPGFRVKAMQEFNGELYVGGNFTNAGAIAANNIAKWNGTSWSAIGSGTNGEVNAFHIYNGELYVGGAFTVAGGVNINYVAKLNGTTFSAVGTGTNGAVNGMNTYVNDLYVTGAFTSAGGNGANNLARWNGNGWYNIAGGLNFDGYCLSPSSGNLYIGGFFSVAGPVLTNSIVRYFIPTAIDEIIADDAISIYPNPSNGNFTLQWKNKGIPGDFKMDVFSARGENVYSINKQQNFPGQIMQLNFSMLKQGLYFIKITGNDGIRIKKITII